MTVVPFAAREGDVGDALAAAAGHPIVESGGALAVAAIGDRQNHLLGLLHRAELLLAQRFLGRTAFSLGFRLDLGDGLFVAAAVALQVGGALPGARFQVAQYGEADDPVSRGEPNAAHARRITAGEDAQIVAVDVEANAATAFRSPASCRRRRGRWRRR